MKKETSNRLCFIFLDKKRIKLIMGVGFLMILLLPSAFSAEGDYVSSFYLDWTPEPRGITVDNTLSRIYIADDNGLEVYVYNMKNPPGYAGNPPTYYDNWDVEFDGITSLWGITTDGTWLYVTSNGDDSIYRYYMDGSHDTIWALDSDNTFPKDIATDGNNIWVIDGTDDLVYEHEMDGSEFNVEYSLNVGNDIPYGITTDGNYVWIVDGDRWVYKYDMSFNYISKWYLTADNAHPRGITQNGTYFWVTDTDDDFVYVYEMYDTEPPAVTINYPEEGRTYYIASTTFGTIVLNVTAIDDVGMADCNFTLGSPTQWYMTNYSTSPTQWTRSIAFGLTEYTATFQCWDTSGNINNTESVTFQVAQSHRPRIIQQIITGTSLKRIASITKQISQPTVINLLTERTKGFVRNIFQSIILMRRDITYDFSGVFTSQAFNKTVETKPPTSYSPSGEKEFTSYTEIASSDDTYYTSTNLTGHVYHKFEMAVKESEINYVDVTWEGYTSGIGNVSLWVWDYTLNNWSLLDSNTGTTDFTLYARVSNLNDVRQANGNITFLVQD